MNLHFIQWHGGKGRIKRWIISQFPKNYQNLCYLEICGGGAACLLNKDKSKIEVYNDINFYLYNLFYQIKYNYPDFHSRIKDIRCNRKTFEFSKAKLKSWEEHEALDWSNLDIAVHTYIKYKMSRGGLGQGFSWSNRLRGGRPEAINRWENSKSKLKNISERLQNVLLLNMDGLEVLKMYNAKDCFTYIDSPYLQSTRTAKNCYEYEVNEKWHEDMLDLVLSYQGKVLISGYMSDLYKNKLKNWNCYSRELANNAGQGKIKSRRVEFLWRNY